MSLLFWLTIVIVVETAVRHIDELKGFAKGTVATNARSTVRNYYCKFLKCQAKRRIVKHHNGSIFYGEHNSERHENHEQSRKNGIVDACKCRIEDYRAIRFINPCQSLRGSLQNSLKLHLNKFLRKGAVLNATVEPT